MNVSFHYSSVDVTRRIRFVEVDVISIKRVTLTLKKIKTTTLLKYAVPQTKCLLVLTFLKQKTKKKLIFVIVQLWHTIAKAALLIDLRHQWKQKLDKFIFFTEKSMTDLEGSSN